MTFRNLETALATYAPILGPALQFNTPVRTGALKASIKVKGEFNGTSISIIITLNDYYKYLEHKYGYASRVNNLANLQKTGDPYCDIAIDKVLKHLDEALSKDIEEASIFYK